jgi:hypothetical protein
MPIFSKNQDNSSLLLAVFFNQMRRFFPARFKKIKKFISISDRHLQNRGGRFRARFSQQTRRFSGNTEGRIGP